MNLLFFLPVVSIHLLSNGKCKNKTNHTDKLLKGRLEIAGICSNYTISILEGDPGKNAVDSIWRDEFSHKMYSRVFKLGNPCSFPSYIKEGDEFYFKIISPQKEDCIVCLAHYPTPSKSLSIKVITINASPANH